MASNDPTDTGGLFVGRRPGTRPVRFPDVPRDAMRAPGANKALAWFLLFVEMLLCVTVWGPQPALALWFGTLAIARRVDHAWKLVRRAPVTARSAARSSGSS